jgi:DNA-binding FadR family transcriptional regulator
MAGMGRILGRSEAATSLAEYEAQDDAFHRAVAEAGENVLLVALFDQLNGVRRAVAWVAVRRTNAKPPADHSSFGEHRRIAAAIADRDADTAWQAMRGHLKSVSARLFP